MTLVRFRPLSSAVDPFRDMNRLFDSALGQPEWGERRWAPAIEVSETDDEIVVSADLPGLNEKDIHLSVTGDFLTIKGERQGKDEVSEGTHYRGERWFGKFERTLSLPVLVQTGQAKATYRDGVLTVKLPKAEEIKPREIKIEAA